MTLTAASWFNDINNATYEGVGIAGLTVIASAAAPDIFAATTSHVISYTGTATATSFATAVRAGESRELLCSGAAVFTNGTNFIVAGGDFTAVAGDRILCIAETTTKFRLFPLRASGAALAGSIIPPQGRLTLTTAVPVTTSDVTAATTLYYTPYQGISVPIYDGTSFANTTFAELSQLTTDATKSPAAVAASKVYDIFVWNDAGTLRATRGPAWTNDTTPGYTLTLTNGILLNTSIITNGPAALRGTYVGTVRSDASSQLNDSLTLRYVWNMYNRVLRQGLGTFSTDRTTASATYVELNSEIRVSFVIGRSEDVIVAMAGGSVANSAPSFCGSAIGFDGTTAQAGLETNCVSSSTSGTGFWIAGQAIIAAGAHYATLLGATNGGSTGNWEGNTTLSTQAKVYINLGIRG